MPRKVDIWFPTHVGDYLGETGDLNLPHHGAYHLLKVYYWKIGPLPDDDHRLASYCKISVKEWQQDIKPYVAPLFRIENGKWVHPYLDKQRDYFANKRETLRKNGMKGALATHGKERVANATPNATPNATAFVGEPTPTPNLVDKSNTHTAECTEEKCVCGQGSAQEEGTVDRLKALAVHFQLKVLKVKDASGNLPKSQMSVLQKLLTEHGFSSVFQIIDHAAREAPKTGYEPQTVQGILQYVPVGLAAANARVQDGKPKCKQCRGSGFYEGRKCDCQAAD